MDLQQLLLALLAHIGVLKEKKSQTVGGVGGPVVAVVVLVLVIVLVVVGWGDNTVVVLLFGDGGPNSLTGAQGPYWLTF